MIDVGEMKKRILGTLEEAGNKRVRWLLPDVIDPIGEPQEPEILAKSLRELLGEGLIVIRMVSLPYGCQSLSDTHGLVEISKLPSHYDFNAIENYWDDSRCVGPPYFQTPEPEVALTKAGREKSVALLEELGSEWWRPKL